MRNVCRNRIAIDFTSFSLLFRLFRLFPTCQPWRAHSATRRLRPQPNQMRALWPPDDLCVRPNGQQKFLDVGAIRAPTDNSAAT